MSIAAWWRAAAARCLPAPDGVSVSRAELVAKVKVMRAKRAAEAAAALPAASVDAAIQDNLMGADASKPRVSPEQEAQWRELRGHELEPALESGAIAMLDGRWLVACAERGERIRRRQDLPPEAFISLEELKVACPEYGPLPIICLSYAWLHPDHPDPKGAQLAVVARALKAMLSEGRWGIFWDYGSLLQHERTEAETELFKQGLGFLGSFYSHPQTTVFRLTTFPAGYPEGYDLPSAANVAAYPDRGWCFTESSWATMTKGSHNSLDLGRLTGDERRYFDVVNSCRTGGSRPPPLLPERFAERLEEKRFTNGKDDKPLVAGLYKQAFEEEFGKAEGLRYRNLGWGDAEAIQISELLASGAAPKLWRLELNGNQIGDEGMKALADAIAGGAAPALRVLSLGGNKASQAAKDAITSAADERSIYCIM
ncbi:hypothetical protein EMIHUDRAFT_122557 [Emiliania huxleyi CCMP1516]|uniref:Uncharacterized protein n=2 Tax=Emiliania huxleyi TaxID=2903 RepID=A0A0D3KKE0_EMIH1|nr:hypothetical protein EMIHUDRAFT_122557 [Emiliania huxleyi CCMP1516]EOD36225.1 hypothetical protein EMIHUDRAFT_122557 [Emiliania huxleyi CCMP1516]|eukprot:XP_005788654.1 hypothetical protein EMIHUDRAFT_122557 [Emiliania huxleyi CCMP1516]